MKHKHHIIPRHMGGTDAPSNLIELTIEEHAEAHRKLYEKYGDEFDRIAHLSLSGAIGKEEIIEMKLKAASARSNGNTGRELSEEWKENIGKSSKKKWEELKSAGYNHSDKIGGEKNGMYGRKHSEESRRKMSEAVKERVSAPDYISPNKGVARTEEQKKKQSESMKGKPAWNKGVERTEEDKRKVSEGHKKLYAAGHINHFKGKTHSPETKAKMKAYWAKRREGLN